MSEVSIRFDEKKGPIGPINAVNNGPVPRGRHTGGNVDSYAAAEFPYARTHDANILYNYGGPHIVDITAVFPDFSADENDPGSYDFFLTDRYLKTIREAGTKIFYRLGQSIEHWPKKYGILPPRDFNKWARIAEHLIRHYTEGWADGFTWDVEYWEIWNEPDLYPDDAPIDKKSTWGGTEKEFHDFYEIAAKHLKGLFPHLKIGGPGLAWRKDWAERFLTEMKKRNVPIDFFSWHVYPKTPDYVGKLCTFFRELLDRTRYADSESILNEWNYVRDFEENWYYSIDAEAGLKGASFAAAVLSVAAASPVDMLMYYDARPGAMNGFFEPFILTRLRKTYFPYVDLAVMKRAGERVASESDDPDVYALAVSGENGSHVLLTYFNDDDSSPEKSITLRLPLSEKKTVDCFLTDDEANEKKTMSFTAGPGEALILLPAKLYSVWHIVVH